ncbi:hypothetical protein AMS68_003265 [Peltaster fructicola]|uniref:Uncharacterized protein n=1 Tax=Peltaster fructicola TaxID=286661 RepID=A0A6H0XT03_9PEZI|nr:hypothetical protein AMS68_003265 [Peltaster fructicola]
MGDEARPGAVSAPRYHSTTDFASRSMTTPSMSASLAASPVSATPSPAKTMPNLMHAKLHKRGGSGSGSALGTAGQPTMSTSFNNAIEPFPNITTPVQASPIAKVKPYLRKLSSTQDDSGRIDLSKSLAENEKVAGLGIQDFAGRPSTEAFPPKATHARTTSVGSQMSTGSGSYRPQPFIHPMRQAPRPYTPSRSTSAQDEEDDFAEDDCRPSYAFRTRRSMSNSSAQVAPTPLSQTITAADLSSIPRLTSGSQSNLSIISTKSSMPNGSRRNTGRSTELATSPSSRTSFDRTFGPRRSDTSAQTRDERIQAARRKFQEKEAGKDRKAEKEAMKRREAEDAKEQRRQQRQRGKSDASERARPQRPAVGGRTGSALGMVSSLAYEPTTAGAAMPTHSEKQPRLTQAVSKEEKSGFFLRLLSCGGSK